MSGRLWRLWLVVGLLATGGYLLIPAERWYGDLLYNSIGLASALVIVAGTRRHRPGRRAVWYCFAAGEATWVVGDTLFSYYRYVLHRDPFPSVADVCYLGAYPVIMVGLVILTRGRTSGRDRAGLIDACVIVTGLGLLYWTLLIRPIALDTSVSPGGWLLSLGYLVADLVMIAMIARLLTGPGARTASYRFLIAAILLLAVSDVTYALLNAYSGYHGGAVDAGWLLSYVLWGAAALHPSMRTLSEPATEVVPHLTRSRLVLLAGAALLAPTALVGQGLYDPGHIDWITISVGAVVLIMLVLARLSGLVSHVQDQATHDELTGLGNRRLLHRRMAEALAVGAPEAVHLAVIDLDDFKMINDRLGHHVGDELLVAVARRLTAAAGTGAAVARLGGDEFAILLAPCTRDGADAVLARVAEALRRPVWAGGQELLVLASAGVGDAAGATQPRELLRRADVALDAAKDRGKHQVARYDPELDRHATEDAHLGAQLRKAIDAGELYLVYQPIVELPHGRLAGAEVLVRWRHPERGSVAPDVFIPVAERSGLIVPLGEWVLREACEQAARWRCLPDAVPLEKISVNVSARQLCEPEFPDTVARIIRDTGMEPSRLVVEVTETAVFGGGTAMESVRALHRLGVTIALDDFGTGHSSLGLLRTCPVDILKVDKSFVDEVASGSDQDVIATALIHIANGMGLQAVAEGVETVAQADHLYRLGYHFAQGYHFARPLPAEEFGRLLRGDGGSAGGGDGDGPTAGAKIPAMSRTLLLSHDGKQQ
ncbi:putative bifunctional diguanylate cyclase/phosphodiesterase [Planosporangium sp. 12N6]|uniref:putative bifunctional diguanylate cyclase/phosphodiesterase n=1 Tax=Planosporangium spinosum TaxID=3402278 RepID=UPI003CF9E0E1